MRHWIVSHACCAIGRGLTRRWRHSIENRLTGGTTTTIRCPIIRSERFITGAHCCAFGEAALEHGLLSPFQLEPIRQDLETSLPGLGAWRQLVVIIPASLEEHPRVIDLLRDGETLPRLRRVHQAFGEALRKEHVSREIDSLDR
jgi:hypothetical protein